MVETPKLIIYVISFYFLALGLLQVALGIYGLTYGLPESLLNAAGLTTDNLSLYLVIGIIIGVLEVISSLVLFSFKNWARYVVVILGIFSSPGWIGVGLMLVILYFLWWYKPVISLFVKNKKVNEWGEEVPS